MSEFFPPCFSCSNNYDVLRSSSGYEDKNIVEIPEAIIAGHLTSFIRSQFQVDLLL